MASPTVSVNVLCSTPSRHMRRRRLVSRRILDGSTGVGRSIRFAILDITLRYLILRLIGI